jgi:VWFA-related protein
MNRSLALVVVGVACLGTVGEAQQKPAQSQPTFRSAVELVQLDVTVLDKDHHPVTDLAQSDFTILEDGKPQKSLSFASFDATTALGANAVKAPVSGIANVEPDVVSNELPQGRLFVLLFDDALIPFEPKIIADAKKIGTDVVSHLEPTDRMAVVFTAANRSSQDFTNDRTRLQMAVDSLNPRYASWFLGYDGNLPGATTAPNLDMDGNFYATSLHTLASVVDYLADSPDRRKVLIYVSPGVPLNYEMLSPVLAHGTGKGMPNLELHRGLAQGLPELFRRAQRANVAVYAIDPTGLNGLESYVQRRLMSLGIPAIPALGIAHKNATLAMDTLNTAAANTGGRAIVNTNDFAPGIAEMFEESRSYYLLAYAATDPGSGNMHRLEVKVNRPGVEVLTRHGY